MSICSCKFSTNHDWFELYGMLYFPQLQVYLNSSRLSSKYLKVRRINEHKVQPLNADVLVLFHGIRARRLSCKYKGIS